MAWIPREGKMDRFYVRMDTKDFTFEEALGKINQAIRPHSLFFQEVVWYSHFSVKESVAESFLVQDRIFLAGDACHIHSVNGGQGLNTGIGDAFNLMWKLNMVLKFSVSKELLLSYENERKSVAQSVIEGSGELVRSTKYSKMGTHAQDYVKIVQKRAGNITGMGIRYGEKGLPGSRLFDLDICHGTNRNRLYSLLDYTQFTLLIFGELPEEISLLEFVKLIQINPKKVERGYWAERSPYERQAVLVRPDSYIESMATLDEIEGLFKEFLLSRSFS